MGLVASMKFNSIAGVCVYLCVHERERIEYLELTVESIHLCISTLEC